MDIALPPHAYVPGKTPRHEEQTFDKIKSTIPSEFDPSLIAQSPAFFAGVLFLENGFFWEAHEVLEPLWILCPANAPEKAFLQGIIQVANAKLKLLMERPKAAQKIYVLAKECFESAERNGVTELGGVQGKKLL